MKTLVRLKSALQHPATRGLSLDDSRNTLARRQVVQEKGFLREIYCAWYEAIRAEVPSDAETLLEIGSGPGFIRDFFPHITTSEVFPVEGVDRVEDAHALSFDDASLDAIIMTDVLHHIPNVQAFFTEASRVLRPGGRLVMIEPWRTRWSQFVYKYLHHEPFVDDASEWQLPAGGPLSMANGAIPWMVFDRDRAVFAKEFTQLRLLCIQPMMPVAYLASGGLATRFGLPNKAFPAIRGLERNILKEKGAMFALITIEKMAPPSSTT